MDSIENILKVILWKYFTAGLENCVTGGRISVEN